MDVDNDEIKDLSILNQIVGTLNRAIDVRSVLDETLQHLVALMSLETGWIALKKLSNRDPNQVNEYKLAAFVNLPPALSPDTSNAWNGLCDCQRLCNQGLLTAAINEVHCSRLASAMGERRGLAVHASVPLRSGDKILGLLNVAGSDWESFSPKALAVLGNVGNQMGVALERARLFDLLQDRHINEQDALLELSNQLLSRSDLDGLLGLILAEARRLLEADASSILIPREDGRFDFKAATGWKNDPAASQQFIQVDVQTMSKAGGHIRQFMLSNNPDNQPPLLLFDLLWAEGFRSHVVIPLVREGKTMGILLLDYRSERQLDEGDIRFLSLMANQAAIAIEQARLREEELARLRLEKEMEFGRQVQLSLLPKTLPTLAGWDLALTYRPARQLSGDFYDFIEFPGKPDFIGLVISDAVGKGVPASLLMAISRTVLRSAILTKASPSEAMKRANTHLLRDSQVSFFVSAFYARLDIQTGRLIYANAGHNHPVWLQVSRGVCQPLDAGGAILGIRDEIVFKEKEITVEVGDFLVFYTDGLTEAVDKLDQQFGEERLHKVIQANSQARAQEMMDMILAAIQEFTGDTPQHDDQTIMVLKRN